MYHFIYETTNNVNGKLYRGAHSSETLDDKYLGSGLGLKRAIREYGKDNFTRKIIAFAQSQTELYQLENTLVDKEWCARSDTYNMKPGGKGAPKGDNHHYYGKRPSEEAIEKQRQAIKETLSKREWKQTGANNPNYGRKHTDEARARIGAGRKGVPLTPEVRQKISETKKRNALLKKMPQM